MQKEIEAKVIEQLDQEIIGRFGSPQGRALHNKRLELTVARPFARGAPQLKPSR